MRKNSTDHPSLFNRNFGLVCVAGFLLYATAYAVLLPLMRSGLASDLCFPFLIGMQLGGLFSAYAIFYSKSASFTGTAVFFCLLVAVLVANEFLRDRLSNVQLLVGLYALVCFAFFTFFLPVMTGIMNQAMFLAGGDYWADWFPQIREQLLAAQKDDGAWPSNHGEAYGTAMSLLILQVPNRYLPIFQR